MKIELEHSDICKALAYYLRTKNFVVDADPINFVFKEENTGELLVIVKNGDMVVGAAQTPPPAAVTPRPAAPAARPQPAAPAPAAAPVVRQQPKARIFAKNDPFEPVPPPREQIPAPRLKILDPQAARSPALLSQPSHPAMPTPREVVQSYGTEKKGEEMVEEAESAALPSGLIVDPTSMSEEDQKLFQDILSRSASQIEDGPTAPDVIPTTAADLDMMGAGELLE